MKTTVFILTLFLSSVVLAQEKPTTGYAPVNGLKMYYEIHGSGEPVVLLHGSFMTITNNWAGWIGELSKTRKVIAIEMQGHGRTADIKRDFNYENLADDVAALLDHLKIPRADLIGYSMGGGVAMQCAIRHPEKVRKVVSISAVFRLDGMVKEGLDAFPKLTAEAFKGSPIETEYKKLSPTPDEFPNFVKRVIAMDLKPHDFGADKLKATKAPMFFIHGDADGVRLDHIAEMFRLKGGEIHGDMRPRSASRLAILPDTTHVTLMERMPVIVPMVNDFFDAPQELGHGYQRSGDYIFFRGKRIDLEGRHDIAKFSPFLTLCHDVDAASFVPLSEQYSKDKNRVYYKWISPGRFWVTEMADADPQTFEVLDFNLAKDEKHVWTADRVVSGADPATAVVVNPHWTWKDSNRVYYQAEVLRGADPSTFRHLGQGYYRDAKQVFWCTTLLTGADVATFETYGDVPYARDRSHVWAGTKILKNVEAKSFQLLHNHVYKDAKHVFVSSRGVEVLGADPATFEKVAVMSGHDSAFEPEKHGVTFPGHNAVLFRDVKKFYVFEPDYGEMYALESKDDVIVVSKPLWIVQGKSSPVQGGTVTAKLSGDSLSEPVVTLMDKSQSSAVRKREKEKLTRHLKLFIAARDQMRK